jgi:molecular chaperone GrpE
VYHVIAMTKKSPTKKDLEAEIARLKDLAARAQADLQNAKARANKEAQDIRTFAAVGVIGRLLPTLDGFTRAIDHLPDDLQNHEWVQGVVNIEKDLTKNLADMGLKKIDALGKDSDPEQHEVLMTAPGEEGKVIEVLEEGYEFKGKVLRPSKVKVGSG